MTKERWNDIVGQVKDNFSIEEEGKEELPEEEGVGDRYFVVFTGPLGRMMLELVERPVILDKKTIYSNRIGSQTQVEYVYSEDEKTYKMHAYRWDEAANEWMEMEAGKLSF
jgi:hypothetical protein